MSVHIKIAQSNWVYGAWSNLITRCYAVYSDCYQRFRRNCHLNHGVYEYASSGSLEFPLRRQYPLVRLHDATSRNTVRYRFMTFTRPRSWSNIRENPLTHLNILLPCNSFTIMLPRTSVSQGTLKNAYTKWWLQDTSSVPLLLCYKHLAKKFVIVYMHREEYETM